MSNWFEETFGFREGPSYEDTRSHFRIERDDEGSITLVAAKADICGAHRDETEDAEERRFHVGKFETPSVAELGAMLAEDANANNMTDTSKASTQQPTTTTGGGGAGDEAGRYGLTFRHVVADVARLHQDPSNAGYVFQAASQFNCLEMPSPKVTPEDGITNYMWDHTQGPACAMACPAGTLYRNYFVGEGGRGQGRKEGGKQLDTLSGVEAVLGKNYWKMKNGYALPVGRRSMFDLKANVDAGSINIDDAQRELRVGVHWDTQVSPTTTAARGGEGAPQSFNVAQVYCSAVPIAYDYTASKADWEPLARLCLNGSYEATLAVAAILARRNNRRIRAYLTKVGGGVFGNDDIWISDAINRSLQLFQAEPIDVYLVHYGSAEKHYLDKIDRIGGPDDGPLER